MKVHIRKGMAELFIVLHRGEQPKEQDIEAEMTPEEYELVEFVEIAYIAMQKLLSVMYVQEEAMRGDGGETVH